LAIAKIDVYCIDEGFKKHGPSLSHQCSCALHLLPTFGFLIAGGRSEKQISANNTSKAFRDSGMSLGRNLYRLVDSGEGCCGIAT
jgi:hypothetical protein